MKATFLCELEVGSDTDLLSIAEDLSSFINSGFDYEALSCKPWSRPTLGTTAPTLGGAQPPSQTNQNKNTPP